MTLPRRTDPPLRTLLPALALGLFTSACAGTRDLADPCVRIQTTGGVELGVSTDYGLVFLGRTAQSGEIEVTAWYGDGPSIEVSVIEPITSELYTAETEVRLPSVPMSYTFPTPGSVLRLRGRTLAGPWEAEVTVQNEPRAEGLVVDVPAAIEGRADQIGAGLYEFPDGDRSRMRLVGLVSGRVRFETRGGPREYLTIQGPNHLWRLVTLRRDPGTRRRWVYREDVL